MALLGILFYPAAEEIFWRAYILEQLRKLSHSAIALLIHSVLFSLGHLILVGLVHSIAAFWLGVLLGVWRIKFRSLFPLILAHSLVNAIATVPELRALYDVTPILAKPSVGQIGRLTHEPASKAVPLLIGFLSDNDQDVRNYAASTLLARYRGDAEPYLKEALLSKDSNSLEAVLLIVEMGRYSSLRDQVRDVAWSPAHPELQMSATLTLKALGDIEGLQMIAERHSDETIRRAAEHLISGR
jgi:hypothetical protein